MIEWLRWVETQAGLSTQTQVRLLITLVVILGLWILRIWLMRLGTRADWDVRAGYQWRRTINTVYYLLVVSFLGSLWLGNLTNVATYLGLVSAGLAIALRDPVTNAVGWLFLVWRRPFEVGDRIQIGDLAGDVIDQRIFQFTILEVGNWVAADQSTGRVIHIPNGKIFTEPLANYSKGIGYIWNEIPVTITFESDWREARRLLGELAREHAEHLSPEAAENVRKAARKYMLYYQALTPTVYTSVRENGVTLTIRYLCRPHERRGSEQVIWEAILSAFASHADIDFAYPTWRVYREDREGKLARNHPGTRKASASEPSPPGPSRGDPGAGG